MNAYKMGVYAVEYILDKINKVGFLPLIVLDNVSRAVPLGKALVEAGIPFAEVTFRTENAARIIKEMTSVKGLYVGAGTVHTIEQAKIAYDNGATFIVTPGIKEDVVKWCQAHDLPIVPGCAVPSDVELALSLNLDTIKFFPAESYGGVNTLKALSGPFSEVKIIPTGGITEDNFGAYLSLPNVIAVGGSFITPSELVNEGKFSEIVILIHEIQKKMFNFNLGHIGINQTSEDSAISAATQIANIFDLKTVNLNKSIYVEGGFEILKQAHHGNNGHICLTTATLERAYEYLSNKNVKFREDTRLCDKNGRLKSIFLEQEVGGFAFQLLEY